MYIKCREVLNPPSDLAPRSTTNCLGPPSIESPSSQISIFCQTPSFSFCLFVCLSNIN